MLLLALAAMAAVSDDWPQLLGPQRNGVYTGETVGWPSQFAWQKDVGSGFASPVIADGKVILFHRKGDREIVEAFEASTGKTVWTFDSPTHYRDDFGFDNGPRATPTVAGGRVFTFGAEGVLHALDLETGAMLWRLDVNRKFDVPKGWFGAGCSPLVHEGKLYLNIGSTKAGVGAFDPATGNLLWKSSHHETSYSSPVAASFGIVFFTREGILVTDKDSGKVLFEKRWRARSKASANAASPIVEGNLVFVSANYAVGGIVLDFSTNPPKELWSSDDAISAHYATPLLKDGIRKCCKLESARTIVCWSYELGNSGESEQSCNESDLARDVALGQPPYLSLPDHIHHLDALNRARR